MVCRITPNQRFLLFPSVALYFYPTCADVRNSNDVITCLRYADMYQSKKEFREMFDHSLLDKIRSTSEATMRAFPEVFDKVNKKARV